MPFFGGRRICFGKAFAELNARAMLTMMTECFDMSFVNKELYNAQRIPKAYVNMRHKPPVWVELRLREKL